MAAVPDWDSVDGRNTDAELVRGAVAGEQIAFAQIYDRYADRLHDFCVGMLRDFDGAADCVQDAFCLAATRLDQLRDPDKLRPWLYSIARNEALRRLRERRRETPTDALPESPSEDPGPETLAARTELADLVSEVAGGLSERDRTVFDLAFRHGLDGPELADAVGVSHSNANTIVARLKQTVERSLGALLVSRRGRTNGDCPELAAILDGWDGHFNVLMRKRVSRHIESCPTCDEERRRLVTPAALLGTTPVFIPAPAWLREKTLSDIELVSHESPIDGDAGAHRRDRRWVLPVAVLLIGLGASAGLTVVLLNDKPATPPTEVGEVSPESSVQPPTPRSGVPPPLPSPVPVAPPIAPPPEAIVQVQDPPVVSDASPEAPEPLPAPSPQPVPPSEKPPMSFSPTVVAPRPASPTPGGGNGGGRANPPGAGP